jgi:hypothetical protein
VDRCNEWIFEADGHEIIEGKSLESVIRTLYAEFLQWRVIGREESSVVCLAGLKCIFTHFHYAHMHCPVKLGVFTDRSVSSLEGMN